MAFHVALSEIPKPDEVSEAEVRDVERQIIEVARARLKDKPRGDYDCEFRVARHGDAWVVDHLMLTRRPTGCAKVTCLGWGGLTIPGDEPRITDNVWWSDNRGGN